jgi:uncharacterized protein
VAAGERQSARLTDSPYGFLVEGWPYRDLDVARLRAGGWRPTAFRQFVLKVHQRCNLACDYCYVYELADQSWRDRPAVMSPPVWQAATGRIREHVLTHQLRDVTVILHGGEPLLAGRDRLATLVRHLHAELSPHCHLQIGMQTNGLLLDEPMLATLHELGISIGVSVDGAEADHDRHRSRRDGRGSHVAAERALALLNEPRYRSSFAGLLCVIDPNTDPIATYEALLRYAPPTIDLLLPHTNWTDPPRPAYAEWLLAVFDRWYSAPVKETSIRLFDEILSLVLGGRSRSEQVGLSPVAVAVVESDGAIEQVDSLKSAYPGAAATGLDVATDDFDAALRHPGIIARQIGAEALCESCLECPVHTVCGGGHYAHRYRAGDGFRNPSVYCADLKILCAHVAARVDADLPSVTRADRY